MEKRNTYKPEFKTKVDLEVLREAKTVNQVAADYELSPVMVSRWKAEFLEKAAMVFEKGPTEADKLKKEYEARQEQLEKKIGQVTIDNDFLKKKSGLK